MLKSYKHISFKVVSYLIEASKIYTKIHLEISEDYG